MYPTILAIHSLIRWLVLLSLLYSIYRAYSGWLFGRVFTSHDDSARKWTSTVADIQFLVGLWLYFLSPAVTYFLHSFREAVHVREIRFFGMEHSIVMLIAIALISIGSGVAKRKQTDTEKFKTIAIWYTIGLFLILVSIPWGFSPLVSRPYFRGF